MMSVSDGIRLFTAPVASDDVSLLPPILSQITKYSKNLWVKFYQMLHRGKKGKCIYTRHCKDILTNYKLRVDNET